MGGCTSKDKTVAENEGCVKVSFFPFRWWVEKMIWWRVREKSAGFCFCATPRVCVSMFDDDAWFVSRESACGSSCDSSSCTSSSLYRGVASYPETVNIDTTARAIHTQSWLIREKRGKNVAEKMFSMSMINSNVWQVSIMRTWRWRRFRPSSAAVFRFILGSIFMNILIYLAPVGVFIRSVREIVEIKSSGSSIIWAVLMIAKLSS